MISVAVLAVVHTIQHVRRDSIDKKIDRMICIRLEKVLRPHDDEIEDAIAKSGRITLSTPRDRQAQQTATAAAS